MRTVWLVLLVVSCNAEAPEEHGREDGPVSYAADIQPIWDQFCIGCHAPGTEKRQEPFLHAGTSHATLMAEDSFCYLSDGSGRTLRLVEPFAADDSGISLILGGSREDVGCLLGTMPRGAPPLRTQSPDEWELVRRWVAEGALDN